MCADEWNGGLSGGMARGSLHFHFRDIHAQMKFRAEYISESCVTVISAAPLDIHN